MKVAVNVGSILTDPVYPQLKAYVLDHTGLHYYSDKDEDFVARILRRMKARGVQNCSSYLAMLGPGAGAHVEIEALIGELTIGETYFFRQREHFDLLRTQIIPELLERNAQARRLRIWSAGCATGAEPYSISVLLQIDFAAALQGWDISILGTDINTEFLDQARSGEFGAWALRALPEELHGIFSDVSGGRRRLRERYRQNVFFEYNNLAGALPYPGSSGDPFDLILCRNVLIYFSRERMMEVAARLHASLREDGWLLVGYAEASSDIFSKFSLGRDGGSAAYRRMPSSKHAPVAAGRHRIVERPPSLPHESTVEPSPTSGAILKPPERIVIQESPTQPTIEDARLLANSGRFDRAIEICNRWLESDPLHAPAHLALGLMFEHTSSPVEAQRAFRRAIYLDRGLALAHYHLGASLHGSGNSMGARKSLENVIELLHTSAAEDPAPEGDGMTFGELRDLAIMHLELISEADRKE
jgi:chemotaxis protein methyltransferase CheR